MNSKTTNQYFLVSEAKILGDLVSAMRLLGYTGDKPFLKYNKAMVIDLRVSTPNQTIGLPNK